MPGARLTDRLGIPYRNVLAESAGSTLEGHVEATVGGFVQDRGRVLLVDDLIQSPALLRQCAKRLSDSGAAVQVLGWAVKRSTETE